MIDMDKTVSKFLSWKFPEDFTPDGGVSFDKKYHYESIHYPIGTNLFTATQAKEMFEQCVVCCDEFNLDYTCKRIRRMLNALNIKDPSAGNDIVLMGCLFSLLGVICNKLEAKTNQ